MKNEEDPKGHSEVMGTPIVNTWWITTPPVRIHTSGNAQWAACWLSGAIRQNCPETHTLAAQWIPHTENQICMD